MNVDVTAYYKGYHGDLNETFVVGKVNDESKKLVKATYEVSPFCLVCLLVQRAKDMSIALEVLL